MTSLPLWRAGYLSRAAVAGWGGLGVLEGGQAVPPGVLVVGEVPHDWLFPRCAAVVHHGGAGALNLLYLVSEFVSGCISGSVCVDNEDLHDWLLSRCAAAVHHDSACAFHVVCDGKCVGR